MNITPAEFWSQLEQQERERKAIKSAREIRATGNSLAAQNDEPEPLTEEQKLAADLSYARNGKVREQRRDRRALELQVAAQDVQDIANRGQA